MAFPALVGGADCGPSNPLQGLTKRFDQDRGLQQDHFGTSSRHGFKQSFRTQETGPSNVDQDAARFFSPGVAESPSNLYDFSSMGSALPIPQLMNPEFPMQQLPAASGWAADFVQHQPLQSQKGPIEHQALAPSGGPAVEVANPISRGAPWSPTFQGYRPPLTHSFSTSVTLQRQTPVVQANQSSWDQEFSNQELALASKVVVPSLEEKQEAPLTKEPLHDGDELARTAGLLLESIRDEQSPKFQNSQFLGLMKQLRDGLVVVEGNQVVENTDELRARADAKGKGKAVDITQTNSYQPVFGRGPMLHSSQPLGFQERALGESTNTQVDDNDAYFAQENSAYVDYWNSSAPPVITSAPSLSAGWDALQSDWDEFEATSTGIRPLNTYQFQDGNPYLVGNSSQTRHHMLHTQTPHSFLESVLELEAVVQRDMGNAAAWYELGVKQQENEREHKALQALQRAVELDPTHLLTYLALAISHTNDNNRMETHRAIQEWVNRNEKYQNAVAQFRAENPTDLEENQSIPEKFNNLIQCLIAMARSDPNSDVDADIQIALAVLLNTSEDYEKAQDCFRTALAVRPDDWLLYNRVGATMANSGHAAEALKYYYRALELNPAYIRARFNLGISCINLRRYEEAAQHILDALVLQDSDGVKDAGGLNDKRGVTSAALWDSLKTTCLHLQRVDLATLCDRQDLQGFRTNFHM